MTTSKGLQPEQRPRRRLGELMVERHRLLPHQLFQALDRQQDAGGRLATCLLEDPSIREEALLAALAAQHNAPAASIEALLKATPAVLALVPARVVSRLVAVPFADSREGVSIAMRDPSDFAARDELHFACGRRILPHVALEVRIWEAIDRHYGEAAPERYRRLWDRLHRRRYLWQGQDPDDTKH